MIDFVRLEPYSGEGLFVVSGYSLQEVLDWYNADMDSCYKHTLKSLPEIKEYLAQKKEVIDFFKSCEDLFIEYDDEKCHSGGVFVARELKEKNQTLRLVILRYGFNPTIPNDMRVLAHECLHVCQNLLPKHFVRDEEHEAEAYFHSHLMTQIYNLFL